MYDTNNVFAKILRKELPANVIFETDASLAVLDAFPCADGHALLIPKGELTTLEDLEHQPAAFRAQVMADLARLTRLVRQAMGVPAVNTVANSFPASGQVVPHVHFHVLPRTEGDNVLQHPKSKTMSEEQAKIILAKYHAQ